jgi:hypothetical protein
VDIVITQSFMNDKKLLLNDYHKYQIHVVYFFILCNVKGGIIYCSNIYERSVGDKYVWMNYKVWQILEQAFPL